MILILIGALAAMFAEAATLCRSDVTAAIRQTAGWFVSWISGRQRLALLRAHPGQHVRRGTHP